MGLYPVSFRGLYPVFFRGKGIIWYPEKTFPEGKKDEKITPLP